MQGQAQGCFLPGQNFPEYKSDHNSHSCSRIRHGPHAYAEMSTFPAAVLVLYRTFSASFPASSQALIPMEGYTSQRERWEASSGRGRLREA